MKKWKFFRYIASGLLVIGVVILLYLLGGKWAASYYLEKGAEYYQAGDINLAKRYFSRSTLLDPQNPISYARLGLIALGSTDSKQGLVDANYREAAEYFERSLSFGLQEIDTALYSRILERLGFSYWNIEQYQKAISYYEKKVELYPEQSFWARYFTALDAFYYSNQPAKALKVLAVAPNFPDVDLRALPRVYALLARLHAYFQAWDEAERYAELALDGRTSLPVEDVQASHILLARVYGIRGQLAQAENEVKKASAAGDATTSHGCFLAGIYTAASKHQQAIATARAALSSIESVAHPFCMITLGESYLAVGNASEARKYLEEYLRVTEVLTQKDIFIIRSREEAQNKLSSLGF